ncbi:MAG: hypothetical protein ACO3K7_00395 [Candidatus Marinamargulisbacteria bacterium]
MSRIRYIIYSGLLTLLAGYFLLNYAVQLPVAKSFLKRVIQQQFTHHLQTPVTVGELRGNIFTGIQLKDIIISSPSTVIPNTKIDIVTLYFKLSPWIQNWQNLIKHIDISGVSVTVIRSENGTINYAHYLPAPRKRASNTSSTYRINIQNIQGTYQDNRGWGAQKQSFSIPFSNGAVTLDIRPDNTHQITARLIPKNSVGPLSLTGEFNATSFSFVFKSKDLNTNTWARYIVPFSKVTIQNNTFSVEGTLKNRQKDSPTHLPFLFDIALGFRNLSVGLPHRLSPLNQVQGNMTFSNLTGPTILTLNRIAANVKNEPVTITGNILLTTKTLDVYLKNNRSITEKTINSMATPSLEFNADIDYRFQGPIQSPESTLNIHLDRIKYHHQTINKLRLSFNKKGAMTTVLGHHPKMGRIVSGNIQSNAYNIHVNNMPVPDFVDVAEPLLSLQISGHITPPTAHVKITPITPISVMGFPIQNIAIDMAKKRVPTAHATVTIGLKNGQQIPIQSTINLSKNTLSFEQNTVISKTAPPHRMIHSMTSKGTLQKTPMGWHPIIECQVSGVGANYRNTPIDAFKFHYKLDGATQTIDIDSFTMSNGQLNGTVILTHHIPTFIDANLTNIHLNHLNQLSTNHPIFSLWSGHASGTIYYQKNPNNILKIAGTIANFQTDQGQFGTTNIHASMTNNHMKIHSLIFSDLHNLRLEGSLQIPHRHTLSLQALGTVRLDALNYLSTIGLQGQLHIDGHVQAINDQLTFDGRANTSRLKYKDHPIQQLQLDGIFSPHNITLRNAVLSINSSSLVSRGFIDYNVNKTNRSIAIKNYEWEAQFNAIELHYLNQLRHSFLSTVQSSKPMIPTSNLWRDPLFEFHKHRPDYLTQYQYATQQFEPKRHYPRLDGTLNGSLRLSNQGVNRNHINVSIDDFYYNTSLYIKKSRLVSKKITANQEYYALDLNTLRYKEKTLTRARNTIEFQPQKKKIALLNNDVIFNKNIIQAPFQIRYDMHQKIATAQVSLKKNDINLLSLFLPSVARLKNEGNIQVTVHGPLDRMQVTNSTIDLSHFSLAFNSKTSPFDAKIWIDSYQHTGHHAKLRLNGLRVHWRGNDTFRRVTRKKKTNIFKLNGDIEFQSLSFYPQKNITVAYNAHLPYAFFSINYPWLYTGDIITNHLKLTGTQTHAWSYNEKKAIAATLGTHNETGPQLTGNLIFRDGIFAMPKLTKKTLKPRIKLGIMTTLGEGNYIQGGMVGEGAYDLASHVSLEIDTAISNAPFLIGGTLNAPQFSTTIPFYSGSISFLDGVYDLLSKKQQAHFFQHNPDIISDQYVQISPVIINDRPQLNHTIHLRGLRKKDTPRPTDNRVSDERPFQAIGLAIDGNIQKERPNISVFEFDIDDPYAQFPNYELLGAYDIQHTANNAGSESSYYGISLLMPDIITNSDDNTLKNYGRQRINSYFKRSVRPYERRFAQRVGLYDFRVTYDFGKMLLNTPNNGFNTNDLLGFQFVSDLYKEKMFLSFQTNIPLSSDTDNTHNSGIKITQVDLIYYLQPNFSIGLKNINEYADVTTFDPRWSLNYGQSF